MVEYKCFQEVIDNHEFYDALYSADADEEQFTANFPSRCKEVGLAHTEHVSDR